MGNKTEVGTYVKLSINNVSSEREGELLNGCSIYLYCLKGFSVSSISNSPGTMSYCNLYIFLFISRNHLTQRVSTLFPGPLVSSIRPSIRQNWTSLSKSNNKKLWKTYLVWSWTIFWRLSMYSMNQPTTPDVDYRSYHYCRQFWKTPPQHFKMWQMGHSGEYGNDAKLVGKMSKSVMQLISIHFWNWF